MPTLVTALPLTKPQPKFTDDMFRSFREFIYRLTGIYFQDNKKYLLEGRLNKRLQVLNLEQYEDYLTLLQYGARKDEEIKFLYQAITINETFFFRNEPQFLAFEQTLVPEIIGLRRTNGRVKLRVWSAASSSGEEAYTLAMIYLEKLKPKFPFLEIEIIGTDINYSVIGTARKGNYRDYSIRNMPKMYLDKYFKSENGRHQVNEKVRRLVRFETMNLYDNQKMKTMLNFDVVFCCNVLIYFDQQSKIQVVSNLFDGLNRNGYLFIGYAETLHGISNAFKLINFPKTVVYKKE